MHVSSTFPREFLCEHTSSKSRVLAVLKSSDCPSTLKAVLTSTDPVLAERAAQVLTAVVGSGGGIAVDAEAERLLAELPAAPAASFRAVLARLRAAEWSAGEQRVRWDQLRISADTPALEQLDESSRTPASARLAQLSGKVFRVTQLVECHVHDTDRLLKAAAADGWSPLQADDPEAGPDDDLLDAVMYFTCDRKAPPGADFVSLESIGELLSAANGDEVVDWQKTPITTEFNTGSRLREAANPGEGATIPGFTLLFPVRVCGEVHADEEGEEDCEVCGEWQLTPRTADILHTSLSVLSDQAHDDVGERSGEPVRGKSDSEWMFFDRLPRLTWGMNAEWRRSIAHACEDLIRDLAEGHWPEPRTTAEEMVLHLAIKDAPSWLEMATDEDFPAHGALPRYPDDYDWMGCSEFFFQDHDVMLLYAAGMDGVEAPDNELNREAGMGDLRPAAWFNVFGNMQPRDPGRTFRR